MQSAHQSDLNMNMIYIFNLVIAGQNQNVAVELLCNIF